MTAGYYKSRIILDYGLCNKRVAHISGVEIKLVKILVKDPNGIYCINTETYSQFSSEENPLKNSDSQSQEQNGFLTGE